MPFWAPITGDDEVLSDSAALTPAKITASQDVAALLIRGKAWSANELAGALAGSSPMAAIGAQVAGWWARKEQAVLISILTGIFGLRAGYHPRERHQQGYRGCGSYNGNAILDHKAAAWRRGGSLPLSLCTAQCTPPSRNRT